MKNKIFIYDESRDYGIYSYSGTEAPWIEEYREFLFEIGHQLFFHNEIVEDNHG